MSKRAEIADVATFLEKVKAWGATLLPGEQAILQRLIQPLSSPTSETELSEDALAAVAGGQIVQDVTVNKAKTADKAYTQMDAYIKS